MTADQLLKKLAQTIKIYRKVSKISQIELAQKLKINYRHLQNIEAGKVDPKLTTLSGFANALNVPLCHMFENDHNHMIQSLNIGCPSIILNMLNIGVLVNDTNGLITYINKKHAEIMGLTPTEVINRKYIWDMIYRENEKEEFKRYFKNIIEKRPNPTPYFSKNIAKGEAYIPIRVEWDYILKNDTVVGFVSHITYHPSW